MENRLIQKNLNGQNVLDDINSYLNDTKNINKPETAEQINSAQEDTPSSKNENEIYEYIPDNRDGMDREGHNGMLLDAGIKKKISWSGLIIWSILIRMVRYWFLR